MEFSELSLEHLLVAYSLEPVGLGHPFLHKCEQRLRDQPRKIVCLLQIQILLANFPSFQPKISKLREVFSWTHLSAVDNEIFKSTERLEYLGHSVSVNLLARDLHLRGKELRLLPSSLSS